jgi:hypothetical protein
MQQPALMFDIEERLYTDKNGELRASMLRQLETLQNTLQGKLRMMNDRATYREIQAAIQAVDGALTVLRTISIAPKNQSLGSIFAKPSSSSNSK